MPQPRPLVPAAIAALALLTACSPATDRPAIADASWRIDSVPIFELGGGGDDDTLAALGNAAAAFRIGDSLIVIGDQGYSSLRFFDLTGRLRDSAGGEGDGPGEFRYLARLFRCGDSLVAQDIQHSQFEVFSSQGVHARTLHLGAPPGGLVNTPYKMACGPTGVWIANAWDTVSAREPTRLRGLVSYWLMDQDGDVTAVLGDWPGSERLTGPRGSRPHPLGKEAVIAVGRDRAYLGTADSFAILVFDLSGHPVDTITGTSVQLATSDADIARYRLLDTLGKEPLEVDHKIREWLTFQFPPTVPAYTALVVDRTDNLWVRLFPRSERNVVRWVVFGPTGEELGQLDLPANLTVYDIGADFILGIETRLDDGGQEVRMYRLHR